MPKQLWSTRIDMRLRKDTKVVRAYYDRFAALASNSFWFINPLSHFMTDDKEPIKKENKNGRIKQSPKR